MRAKHRTTIVALALALVCMSGAASQALTWNPSSRPLTVASNNSIGKAYGSWTISTGTDGTRSRLSSKQAIPTKGASDHKVYVKLSTYVNAGSCVSSEYTSCTQPYYFYDDADTTATSSTTYVNGSSKTGLASTGNFARAQVYTKLAIPLKGDPGAGPTLTKGLPY